MGRGTLDTERLYLNKWEMHKALHDELIGPCLVPETALFSAAALKQYLAEFGSVYVKPLNRFGGANISRVSVDSSGAHWVLTETGQVKTQVYPTEEQLVEECTAHYQGQPCIVQRTVSTQCYEGRLFDIRVHMQRDERDQWTYAGALARVGGPGAIVSNVLASQGMVLPVKEVLQQSLGGDAGRRILEQCEEIGCAICGHLDAYHAFMDVGIDLVVDPLQQVWLIEVNTNDLLGAPSHELFAQLPDPSLYRGLKEREERRLSDLIRVALAALQLEGGQGE